MASDTSTPSSSLSTPNKSQYFLVLMNRVMIYAFNEIRKLDEEPSLESFMTFLGPHVQCWLDEVTARYSFVRLTTGWIRAAKREGIVEDKAALDAAVLRALTDISRMQTCGATSEDLNHFIAKTCRMPVTWTTEQSEARISSCISTYETWQQFQKDEKGYYTLAPELTSQNDMLAVETGAPSLPGTSHTTEEPQPGSRIQEAVLSTIANTERQTSELENTTLVVPAPNNPSFDFSSNVTVSSVNIKLSPPRTEQHTSVQQRSGTLDVLVQHGPPTSPEPNPSDKKRGLEQVDSTSGGSYSLSTPPPNKFIKTESTLLPGPSTTSNTSQTDAVVHPTAAKSINSTPPQNRMSLHVKVTNSKHSPPIFRTALEKARTEVTISEYLYLVLRDYFSCKSRPHEIRSLLDYKKDLLDKTLPHRRSRDFKDLLLLMPTDYRCSEWNYQQATIALLFWEDVQEAVTAWNNGVPFDDATRKTTQREAATFLVKWGTSHQGKK